MDKSFFRRPAVLTAGRADTGIRKGLPGPDAGSAGRTRKCLLMCTTALMLGAGAPSVRAQATIDGGQTVTVPGSQSSPWAVGGTLLVGNTGQGTLTIGAGGVVTHTIARVANGAGSIGLVTVDGAGAAWTGTSGRFIGQGGDGTMNILNGGMVTNTMGWVGYSAAAVGAATVSGHGSVWTNSLNLFVGMFGRGTLTIEQGGTVNSGGGTLGDSSGGTGVVIVRDGGSWWNNTGALTLGRNGLSGEMLVENGGMVTNKAGTLGESASATGRVTVQGAGSEWVNDGALRIGGDGTGVLTIADGGLVVATDVTIANWNGSSGTLNIGAGASEAAAAPGVLATLGVAFGRGDGRIVFNHTHNAYDFSIPVSGLGTVQTLAGTTVFSVGGAMSYSGQTLVDGGVLSAGAADAFSPASEHVVGLAGTLDLAGHAQTVAGLVNAGLVRLNGASPGNTLTVTGNYVGNGGTIVLNTVLGGDSSLSDRVVIDGGTASGSSLLAIVNAGGPGDQTTANGILVVQAANGGTTAPGTFALSGRVAAGAYDYHLFRGGLTNDVAENWYLRSTLIPEPPQPPPPEPPVPPGPPVPHAPPPEAIPLYRPEVALYVPVPAVARQMGLAMLGTLHERVGEEENIRDLASSGYFANGAWVRAFGQRMSSRWEGTVDARSDDANLVGMQAGLDLFRRQSEDGHRDHAGLYLAYSDYTGRISGFSEGDHGARVGRLELDGPALGVYWTHFGPAGWYVDAIAQVSWFDAKAISLYGPRLSTSGTGFVASLEAGYPIRLAGGWQIEPQAQVIYQSVSVDDAQDDYSAVSWDGGDAVTGRVGARLQYTGRDGTTLWQPYGKVNLWHGFSGTDRARFDDDGVDSRFGGTAVEVGGGVTAKIASMTSLYAHVDQTWHLGGGRERTNVTQGAVGIRVNW